MRRSICPREGDRQVGDIRWDLSIGGGSLMDLGCYPVQWLRWLLGPTPEVVSATAVKPGGSVDGHIQAECFAGPMDAPRHQMSCR